MDKSESLGRDLEATLERAIVALEHDGDTFWTEQLRAILPAIRRREVLGLESLLGLYGGMGSINDVVYSQVLSDHLSHAYDLASELLREARLNGH